MRGWILGTALAVATPAFATERTAFHVEDGAPQRIKPVQTRLESWQDRAVIRVKFVDGLPIRLRGGVLSDLGSNALDGARETIARFAAGTWRRAHTVDEDVLDRMRAKARARLNRHVADLNLQFDFVLPPGIRAEDAIDAFNALDCVELADPAPLPPPAPTPPDFQPNQGYLQLAAQGINAQEAWTLPGGTGSSVRIADVEYSWNSNHADLPAITLIGPPVVDPFSNPQHGTATMGQLVAKPNGFGVTGIANGTTMFFAAANTAAGYHPDAAITAITAFGFGPGDVMMLELQAFGPNNALVAAEWDVTIYNAIVIAVGNGVTVVEAAGNSAQDLDAPQFSTGNGGHWPFLPQNDSGAIIVGAGNTPQSADVDRSRMSFSCYGSTVDLQGWGEKVYTCGFGTAYSAEGVDQYYSSTFNGTSASTPIVTGACALVQSIHIAKTGAPLTPAQVKQALRSTGWPQTSGTFPATQNIGPRPDVAAAVQALGDGPSTSFCAGDGSASACPCGNSSPSASARGCTSSFGDGASLSAVGTSSLSNDTLSLLGAGLPNAPLLFLQGDAQINGGQGAVLGDGLRCVGGTLVRLGTRNAVGGSAAFPSGGSGSISQRGLIGAPGVRYYEICYRNAASYCTNDTFNSSNGVRIVWAP